MQRLPRNIHPATKLLSACNLNTGEGLQHGQYRRLTDFSCRDLPIAVFARLKRQIEKHRFIPERFVVQSAKPFLYVFNIDKVFHLSIVHEFYAQSYKYSLSGGLS